MQEAKKIPAFSEADHEGDVIDITSMTSKSSLNSQYIKEKDKIVKKFGSLEDMRVKLGMNKTQIAQLLLVKPATWSRWEKNEDKAPPHVFQALKWYIILADSKPEMRAKAAPEFIYENQLKVIGSELKKIKNDFDFKGELMNMMEDKISSMITQGLTQIQVQIQPIIGQAPAFQLDESFKNDQNKIQTKVENVEFMLRQMREDVSTIKSREPFYQTPMQQQKPMATFQQSQVINGEQINTAAIALKIVLGFLAAGVLGALAYFFVMYS